MEHPDDSGMYHLIGADQDQHDAYEDIFGPATA
jgi:hypothetical protein